MNVMTLSRSQSVAGTDAWELDERPRRAFAAGSAIIGLFFVCGLGFAALVPLDAGAYAEGVVAVSGNRQAVQHRDGGIVTSLKVSEGQMVRKGDLLLTVSASELVAAERAATAETIFLLATRERLRAELSGAAQVQDPKEVAAMPSADRVLANEAMQGQRELFRARRDSLHTERSVLNQKMLQHSKQISGYEHQIGANREQQRLIADEIDGLRQLLPKGYVSLNRLRSIERTASELNGTSGAFRAEAARSADARGEARLQIVALQKQMITDAAGQIREVHGRLNELQPKLVSLREQLGRSIVRAPASGRVVGLSIFTEGGVVAAGDKLMEIVPQDRQLIVEGRVAPTDADDLRPGMATQVRFSGLHERNLPILHGKLMKISADAIEDDRSGDRYFRIEVRVPPEQLRLIRAVRPSGGLQAGMPAEIMIPLRQRTALEYLIEPLTQSLWRAGREH